MKLCWGSKTNHKHMSQGLELNTNTIFDIRSTKYLQFPMNIRADLSRKRKYRTKIRGFWSCRMTVFTICYTGTVDILKLANNFKDPSFRKETKFRISTTTANNDKVTVNLILIVHRTKKSSFLFIELHKQTKDYYYVWCKNWPSVHFDTYHVLCF